MRRLLARLRARHAVLFVIPGGSGGFAPANVELYRDCRPFRESIEATGAIAEKILGWRATAAFRGQKGTPVGAALERRNEIVHHAMTRIALIDQLRAEGIDADGAVGVSLGETITPYAAGAITREECTRLAIILAHAITQEPSAHRTYVIAADSETASRLCRTAPVPVDFVGAPAPNVSLVLCRERDAEAARAWFGDAAILKDAPSGWPYHTPSMYWNEAWASEQLGRGIALTPVPRPVYSPGVGGLLPAGTRMDAEWIRWMSTGRAHFATAVAAALRDGFDTIVQISGRPMHIFADVGATAEALGRKVRQLHAADARARAKLRGMRRRAITPRAWKPLELPAISFEAVAPVARDVETEHVAERLLKPLVERMPYEVVSSLADPLAESAAADRDALRRAIATSVFRMLQDASVRQRVMDDPELLPAIAGDNRVAIAALRALLRVAPGFRPFQPLDTVHGELLQLMIVR